MSKADLIFIEMCKDILENGFSDEGTNVVKRSLSQSQELPSFFSCSTILPPY